MTLNIPAFNEVVPKRPARPCCLCCDKPLKKYTRKVFDHAIGEPDPTERDGQPIVQITHRDPMVYGTKPATVEILSVWHGAWGGYGDNRFCGKTCAWRWALKNTKRPANATRR